jgi:hypothetical protein
MLIFFAGIFFHSKFYKDIAVSARSFGVVIWAAITINANALVGLLVFYNVLKFKHFDSFVVFSVLANSQSAVAILDQLLQDTPVGFVFLCDRNWWQNP